MSLFAGTSLILAFGGMVTFGGAGILIIGSLGCMHCTPAGVFFMWRFAVAVDVGRYFQTELAVRQGHDKNWLLLMALIYVDGGGLRAHW